MFSSPPLSIDPRNHCVPILDVLQDPEDGTISYLVMPFLRDVESPPFEIVDDIVQFIDQILQVRLQLNTGTSAYMYHRA